MALLARRNLFHDRIRFALTLTGIVSALVLIIVQFGLFLGFTTTTSNNIDHSQADLWVVFHGVGYFDTGRMFSEQKYHQQIGDHVEIGDHRARVVGFTHGIRSFTTSPFLYTAFKNALNYTRPESREDQLTYILIKVAPGFSPALPRFFSSPRSNLNAAANTR
jgi:hypothetical protein